MFFFKHDMSSPLLILTLMHSSCPKHPCQNRTGLRVVGLEVGLRVVGLEVGLRVVGLEVPVLVGLRVVGFGVGLLVGVLTVHWKARPLNDE